MLFFPFTLKVEDYRTKKTQESDKLANKSDHFIAHKKMFIPKFYEFKIIY